jgi:hypothetical protein
MNKAKLLQVNSTAQSFDDWLRTGMNLKLAQQSWLRSPSSNV